MTAPHRAFRIATLLACTLPGCGLLDGLISSAPAGAVTGIVTYGGKPAAGKRVTLAGGSAKTVATDSTGRYTFSNVTAGKYQVVYNGLIKSDGDLGDTLPNELASWRTPAFDHVVEAGKEVPSIEVAYNGLLYPEVGMALIVTEKDMLPFHWSVHPRAQRYRVKLEGEVGGFKWESEWVGEPSAWFAQAVETTGRYKWTVEIDGGAAGIGLTRTRQVDL